MNKTEIEEAFKNFESKYNLPPVFQMSDGKILGRFHHHQKRGIFHDHV